ncbi:MAG: ABC transporter permease [Myxococcota bacterium]
MKLAHGARAAAAITHREVLRFVQQRERFVAALVRPLVWLLVFASGLRTVLDSGGDYRSYILPGLCGMVQLFHGMQSSLSMVYDREMGSMRILLTSPLPRGFLLMARLFASCVVSIGQVYIFLAAATVFGVPVSAEGALRLLPALILGGLLTGALGMLLAARIRQLENFAGVMNFVIFPMFFLSPALYPLARFAADAPIVHGLAWLNPFTHAVELNRAALYGDGGGLSLPIVLLSTGGIAWAAIQAYDPARGMAPRRR